MDIDIDTTAQLWNSLDVDKLLHDVASPRAISTSIPVVASKLVQVSAVEDSAGLTEPSDGGTISEDSDDFVSERTSSTLIRSKVQPSGSTKPQSKSRKELIIQQRKLAERLTDELETLKVAPSQGLLGSRGSEQSKHLGLSLWKLAAIRQLGRRREAEEENAQLRDMLDMQVQEAKCLQRILKRRRKIQAMEDMLGMKRRKTGRFVSIPTDNSQIFTKMLRDIDEVHARVTAVAESVDGLPCPGQKRRVNRNTVNGVFNERMQKSLLPFTLTKVKKAMWKVLIEHGVKMIKDLTTAGFHNQQSKESCDTITTSYFTAAHQDANTSGAQVRKAVRMFVDDDRVVFICKILAGSKMVGTMESVGYHLLSTLQVIIRQGETTSTGDDATQLLMHFSVQRHDLGFPTRAKFRQPGRLDDDIALWDKVIQCIPSEVESMLIDEACGSIAAVKELSRATSWSTVGL